MNNSTQTPDPDDTLRIKNRPLHIFFFIVGIEGLIALPFIFSTPSMDRNAFLLGYSLPRIITGFVFLLLDVSFLFVAFLLVIRPKLLRRVLDEFDTRVTLNPASLIGLLLFLLYISLIGAYFLLMFHLSLTSNFPYVLYKSIERSFPSLIWLVAIPTQLFFTLIIHHRNVLSRALRRGFDIVRPLVLFLILTLTTLHSFTLILRAQWISRVTGWFWPYTSKHLSLSNIFIPIAFFIALLVANSLAMLRRKRAFGLITLILLAYGLQIAFGFALGQGYESIRLKYTHTQFSDEMFLACESRIDTITAIRDYEHIYGDSFWYGTKPPGLFAFYALSRDILTAVDPNAVKDTSTCFLALSKIAAVILPLISALIILPISAIDRLLNNSPHQFVASFLFMSAPNVLLMPLAPDQFLFPLLFVVSTYELGRTIKEGSTLIGFQAGMLICLSVFVSFSLLPIVGLAFAWLVFSYKFKVNQRTKIEFIRIIFGIAIGFLLISVILALIFDYNPVTRYMSAFDQHREIKDFDFSISSILQYTLLNNLEFAFWSGMPFFVLVIIGVVRSIRRLLRGQHSARDVFHVAFAFMYLLLNILGQTRGEVGRMWIFLIPLAAIVAANEASRLLQNPVKSILLVLALQLISSMVAFYFLDWPWF